MEIILILFVITTLVCAGKWISYKIGNLTILLYMAESGIELPDSTTIKKYREKVIKKLLRIKAEPGKGRGGSRMEINKDAIAEVCGRKLQLQGHEYLLEELVEWMKQKEVSVRLAVELFKAASEVADMAWCTEKGKVRF